MKQISFWIFHWMGNIRALHEMFPKRTVYFCGIAIGKIGIGIVYQEVKE